MTLDSNSQITEPFTSCAGETNIHAIAKALSRPVSVVSNGDNPNDMRPAADSLAEISIRRRRETGKPVVIITGEAHAIGSQVVFPQHLMQSIKEKAPALRLGHGLERSHNMLDNMLEKNNLDPKTVKNDPDGVALKTAYLEYGHQQAAPLTRHNVMSYCLNNDIPVHTLELKNAIDMDGDGYLDPDDPKTKALIEKYAPELAGQKVPASDRNGMDAKGMRIRNNGIADEIEKNIKHSDIYVVPYGLAHLIGTKMSNDVAEFPTEDSLGAILTNRDIEVILAYPNVSWAKDILPENVDGKVLDNLIVIDGLGTEVFWQSPENTTEANTKIARDEALYLQKLYQHSGGYLEIAPRIKHRADAPTLEL